jgi:hypothetical protein
MLIFFFTFQYLPSPFNATNATGRSFNQSDTIAIANTTLQTNNNQAKQNSSNPIIDTLQKINPLK